MMTSGRVGDGAVDPDISGQLVLVARRLDVRIPEIVREMRDLLATRIEDLSGDPQLVELLQASIEGNVTTMCHILANDIDLESIQPTTAAVEYASRLAQRDVPVNALTRAYYLGQSMFLRLALDEVERLDLPDGVKIDVVRGVADVVHRYIDWILQLVTSVHDTERRRWWTTRATLNVSMILKVLRGDAVPARAFESETGYRLDQRHLGVVVWSVIDIDDVDEQRKIDQVVRRLASHVRSPDPTLTMAADRSTAWAWIALPPRSSPDLSVIRSVAEAVHGVRVAVGDVGEGVAGFRRSHEQALTARLVALSSIRYRTSPFVAYTDPDVALIAVMSRDPIATATWVSEVLGPVAAEGEHHRVVRETLNAFFAMGENYVRTAEALGLHRNTVKQRVARFYAERDGLPACDPIEVALALRMRDALGPSDRK